MARRKKTHDWERIERDYRLGQKSLRTIAGEHGLNASTISRRAKKKGWVQDKSQEVRERTSAAIISQQGNTPTRNDIDVAVKTNIDVIRGHRADISKGRELVDIFSTQLLEAAENRAEIEAAVQEETREDNGPKRRNAMLKAVALPAQASVLRDLSTVLKNLIPLERQAFNLDGDRGDSCQELIQQMVKTVDSTSKGLPGK